HNDTARKAIGLGLQLDQLFVASGGPGEISIADETVDHRPVAEKDRPCIAFAVSDGPVKLTGSFRQMIGDLIG
ncbi:hypothetical protein ACC699_39075, partial [Rhizobium ruizarguesonis]